MDREKGILSQEIDSQHMDPIMELSKVVLASEGTREMYRKWGEKEQAYEYAVSQKFIR